MPDEINEDIAAAEAGLVGQFFHSVVGGEIQWQGYVVARPEPGFYLVQLCEWLDGSPSVRHLIRVEGMTEWVFYPDAEAMCYSHGHGVAREGGPYDRDDREPGHLRVKPEAPK